MSIGAKSSKQGSSQQSQSSSRGEVISGAQLQSPEQRAAEQKLLPVLTQQALADGFTPQERTAATTATQEDINRRVSGEIGGLQTKIGQSGIRGRANVGDVTDIVERGIDVAGKEAGALTRKGIDVADRRKAAVTTAALSPTGRIAQRSSGTGRASSFGKSAGFSFGSGG